MSTITSKRFGHICDSVWRDRVAILTGRGILSGEAALMRAVYWRLCKSGVAPSKNIDDYHGEHTQLTYQLIVSSALAAYAPPHFDGAPFIAELMRRYRAEVGQICQESEELKVVRASESERE